MVFIAVLMAESSSLLIAPLRNWSGWCFSTLLFRSLGVGFGSTVVMDVDCADFGVASGLGIVDTGRIPGVEVAVLTTVVAGVDCVGSGIGSILGADTGRIFGVEVAAVATVVVRVDCTGGTSKIVFSIP